MFGGTPNALLASAKAEQRQVQNWNTQFFSKSLKNFDFYRNLEQNRNSTIKNGIHFKIPARHCRTVFIRVSRFNAGYSFILHLFPPSVFCLLFAHKRVELGLFLGFVYFPCLRLKVSIWAFCFVNGRFLGRRASCVCHRLFHRCRI